MCLKYLTELTVPVFNCFYRVIHKRKRPALKDTAQENSWLILEIKFTVGTLIV